MRPKIPPPTQGASPIPESDDPPPDMLFVPGVAFAGEADASLPFPSIAATFPSGKEDAPKTEPDTVCPFPAAWSAPLPPLLGEGDETVPDKELGELFD